MDLPRIGVKISGNDGKDGTEWSDTFVLDFPSILDTEVVHRRSQVRSLVGLLMAWDRALDDMCTRVASKAVDQRAQEERQGIRTT